MRYFLLGCFLVAAVSAFSYNETVSAISYNPSRMGAYTHLKVAQKAVLKGGLKVDPPTSDDNFFIKSKNGVTVRDGNIDLTNRCPDSANCSRDNQNEITNVQPEGYVDGNVCDTSHGANCQTGLNASSVMVQGISTAPMANYAYTETAPAAKVDSLAVYGGTFVAQAAGATGTESQDSYIDTIPNNGGDNGKVAKLTLTANEVLEVTGSLYIEDSLRLGNITIDTISNPQKYAFVKRKLKKDDETVDVYVLAVK